MKKLLTAILTAAAFAAHAAPAKQPAPAAKKAAPVRNVAIPQTAAELARQSEDNAARLIAKPATEMLAYYDADSRVVEQPAAGGYYRMLVGRTADGKAVVQDFYQDSKTKQIAPAVVPDEKEIRNFSSGVAEGRIVWYSPEGEATNFADIHNGQAGVSGHYEDGKLAEVLRITGNTQSVTVYHPNGKTALSARVNMQKKKVESISIFSETGRLLLGGSKNVKPKADADVEAVARVLQRFQQLGGN